MTPKILLSTIVRPTLRMMGEKYCDHRAQTMLVAIALQESGLMHRVQVGGPAHGLYQFEKGGGVRGVLRHHTSANTARLLCQELLYTADEDIVYEAIIHNDVLATVFARLLLWTDPHTLPDNDDADSTWKLYERVWRPGKPHPQTWAANLVLARQAVEDCDV